MSGCHKSFYNSTLIKVKFKIRETNWSQNYIPLDFSQANKQETLDPDPNFKAHVLFVPKSAFYHKILLKCSHFSLWVTQKLMHTLTSGRLVYCNALLSTPKKLINQLQLIRNLRPECLQRPERQNTLHLKSLHWLPVSFCIDSRILSLIFKALHCLALAHMSHMLQCITATQVLWHESGSSKCSAKSMVKGCKNLFSLVFD